MTTFWPDSIWEGPSFWEMMDIQILMRIHNMTFEEVKAKRKEAYDERTEGLKRDWAYCNKLTVEANK